MDAVTEGLKRQPPWALLYVDDVVLMAENRKELEEEAQRWRDQLGSYGLEFTKKTEHVEVGGQRSGICSEVEPIKKACPLIYRSHLWRRDFKMSYRPRQTHPARKEEPLQEMYVISGSQCNLGPEYTVL
ncbi:unnamed protein product [Strongylus vulgaris]|uniref:Reverse transcriptase domain-containing protein n=1 Tax=Strongylus vulgaris TaxID=40348 RepID=A0A3P7KGA7_STRVU|nr:unnamed protein product [Strongylus vulgaris]